MGAARAAGPGAASAAAGTPPATARRAPPQRPRSAAGSRAERQRVPGPLGRRPPVGEEIVNRLPGHVPVDELLGQHRREQVGAEPLPEVEAEHHRLQPRRPVRPPPQQVGHDPATERAGGALHHKPPRLQVVHELPVVGQRRRLGVLAEHVHRPDHSHPLPRPQRQIEAPQPVLHPRAGPGRPGLCHPLRIDLHAQEAEVAARSRPAEASGHLQGGLRDPPEPEVHDQPPVVPAAQQPRGVLDQEQVEAPEAVLRGLPAGRLAVMARHPSRLIRSSLPSGAGTAPAEELEVLEGLVEPAEDAVADENGVLDQARSCCTH